MTHAAASACSGLAAALARTPADVVKERLISTAAGAAPPYAAAHGSECFARAVRQEGPLALCKG